MIVNSVIVLKKYRGRIVSVVPLLNNIDMVVTKSNTKDHNGVTNTYYPIDYLENQYACTSLL